MKDKKVFPKGFYWGASTSAHQVEGGNINNWSQWEKENANRLAEEARNKWQDWQLKKFPEMLDSQNYISGKAADHYNRYEEDFDIAKKLGHNAHRFSIEWSRIEPEEGKFNEKEIEHYRKVIKSLKKRNIEPFVTLWHWTLPLWLKNKGGLKSKKIVEYFSRYTERVVNGLGDQVTFWITLNEPLVCTGHAYLRSDWPPQKFNPLTYITTSNNLIESHKKAFEIIKQINPKAQVGVARHNNYFEAYKGRLVNKAIKNIADWKWNLSFLNKIRDYQDFIGLNYYHHFRISCTFKKNKSEKVSNMDWKLYPKGIYKVLMQLKKYNIPIYVTESGLADRDDKNRSWYIKETVRSLEKAITAGVDLKGYFYWSLLDNFEWDKGFWPRFGLVEIDYESYKRKVRNSAKEYKKIIESSK